MKTYTFIRKNTFGDNTEVNPILAISKEIETLNLFETYDRFGQQVGHYDAGDYSLFNSDSSAKKDCALAVEQKFNLNDVSIDDDEISSFDLNGKSYESEDYNNLSEDGNHDDDKILQLIIDINQFIANWEKENANYTTVNGFNYWDGHDWKTVVTSRDFYEPMHFVVEENADQMNEEIEASEFIEETHGKRYYESENFWIVKSAWAGDFESYQLFSKSECDLEDVKQ